MLRKAFTLIEVMVLIAILAILASVAVPNVAAFLDRQRILAAKDALDDISAALVNFDALNTQYPSALNLLTDSIRTSAGNSNATNARNSCTGFNTQSGFFTNNQITTWNNNGPFFSRPITTAGYNVVIGTLNNTLVRSPSTGANASAGILQLMAPGVNIDDILLLEPYYDGATVSSAAGSVRWSAPVNGTATLTFVLNITGC